MEAESLPWGSETRDPETVSFPVNQQDELNKELISVIQSRLIAMRDQNLSSADIDPESFERLEKEAFAMSSLSS